MMKSIVKWGVAIAFSLLAHAGAATLFEAKPDQVEIAGGEAMEVTLLGNAFEDTIQAGDPTEPLDPMEELPEQVEPVEPEVAEALPEEIAPIQSEIAAETPSDVPPIEADVILPIEDMPPVAVAEAEVTATVPPAETVVPEEKPEQEPEQVAKPPEIKKPEPKKTQAKEKPVRKKVVRRKTGEDGGALASQKKGQADGVENAKASTAQGRKGAFSRQSGNAAASNYPGKIRAKLNRAFRYPLEAKRQGLRGTAQVRFTVSASGAVSGVSIARSAGSPILDQAAIEAVHRAAPFPGIPDGAGRSNWAFTIPLAFTR